MIAVLSKAYRILRIFVRIVHLFIRSFLDPIPPISENVYYKGNFSPVRKEMSSENLEVIGKIPDDLRGFYVRNGPNPQFTPTGRYHWFDGDGMLHGVHFKDGSASYVNRYIRTERFLEEKLAGKPLHMRLGDLLGPYGLVAIIKQAIQRKREGVPINQRKSTANTALAFHDGRMLALNEADHPYHVHAPSLDTVGRYSYNGSLSQSQPFTAHPKIDPITGEMVFFGYNMAEAPHLIYNSVSKAGQLERTIPITIDFGTMIHDFAATENFVIFGIFPLVFDRSKMIEGKVLTFDHNLPAKFGILPRNAKDEKSIQWFEVDACYVYHYANAWEEDDKIYLFGCRQSCAGLFSCNGKNCESGSKLFRWIFNLKTGRVEESPWTSVDGDFPVTHPDMQTRKTDWTYVAMTKGDRLESETSESAVKIDGCCKINLNSKKESEFRFGKSKYGGESLFVPSLKKKDEDDGYLITFVHDEVVNESELWVVDAKTMEHPPLARIKIPERVPYGFHGKFLTEEEMEIQRK